MYGREGYSIFSPTSNSSISKLPDYIAAVTVPAQKGWHGSRPLCGGKPGAVCDGRGLQQPGGVGAGRVLATPFALHRGTGLLEIEFSSPRSAQVSFYFCDYGGAEASVLGQPLAQALLFTDARSLTNSSAFEQLMPILRVDHAEGGLWISVRIEGSVRVRFAQMSGDQPTLSAVFFDP